MASHPAGNLLALLAYHTEEGREKDCPYHASLAYVARRTENSTTYKVPGISSAKLEANTLTTSHHHQGGRGLPADILSATETSPKTRAVSRHDLSRRLVISRTTNSQS